MDKIDYGLHDSLIVDGLKGTVAWDGPFLYRTYLEHLEFKIN